MAMTANTVFVAQETIEALGHAEYVLNAVAPTCTSTGLTAGVACAACDEVLVEQETVPALGHTAGETVTENVVPVTYGKNGSYDTVTYCTVCGIELSRTTTPVTAAAKIGDTYYATFDEAYAVSVSLYSLVSGIQ